MKALRVIVDPALAGDINMAVDQNLLELSGEGPDAGPTLRFYRWQAATLSLGYFQTLESRQSHSPSWKLDVVRRTTGGGAIVHDHELTYSLTLPLADRWAAEHQRLYDQMHRSIIRVLGEFGVIAGLFSPGTGNDKSQRPHDFLCFIRRARGDIIQDGYKICGSAQRRSATALLQHGSILIKKSAYAPELPGILDLGTNNLNDQQLISGIITEMSATMNLEPVLLGPSDLACKSTLNWRLSRFGNIGWTGKR